MNISNYNDETTLKEIKFSKEINYDTYKEHELWYINVMLYLLFICELLQFWSMVQNIKLQKNVDKTSDTRNYVYKKLIKKYGLDVRQLSSFTRFAQDNYVGVWYFILKSNLSGAPIKSDFLQTLFSKMY